MGLTFVIFSNTFDTHTQHLNLSVSRRIRLNFAVFIAFLFVLDFNMRLYSAVGLLPRPAQSLPAKLVPEHVVRKGVCV